VKFDLLVVNGDSYSDGGGVYQQYEYINGKAPDVFKIGWAQFLAEKLNIPIINLAVGGTSNRSIINKSLRFLENDEFYYHQDSSELSKLHIKDFNLNNYKNILFVTQWSFFHRFPFYVKNEYKEMTPNTFTQMKEFLGNDSMFEKYKEYTDLRFTFIYDEKFDGRNFITDYLLYNSYLSNKKNITHLNWPFVSFLSKNTKYDFVLEKIKSFPYEIIDNDCINLNDLKTVEQETNGAVRDGHFGLESSKIMADRLIDYLKNNYELQQIQMVD
jgi:hypothetical protein